MKSKKRRPILSRTLKFSPVFILLAMLFLVSLENCSNLSDNDPNNDPKGRISGRITTKDGAGLPGVTVYVYGTYNETGYYGCTEPTFCRYTETDENGEYNFSMNDSVSDYGDDFIGTGTIEPSMPGYTFTPSSREISIGGYSNITGLDFMATPIPYSISGRIVKVDGTGIPGITVELTGAASKSTITNENGDYEFTGLYNGSYTITPSLISGTPESRSVSIYGANVEGQDFTEKGYSISGRIITADGEAFPGVIVSLSGEASASTRTDTDGYYTFHSLFNGLYTITPSKACSAYTFEPSFIIVNIYNSDVMGQDFVSPVIASKISGRITTADGKAFPGVTVTLSGADTASTTSDTNGYYTFSYLCPNLSYDSYTITPSITECPAYTFEPSLRTVNVYDTDVMGQDFVGPIIFSNIYGNITTTDGTAIPGVTIILSDEASTTAITDAYGDYVFTSVQACRSYTITPSIGDYILVPADRMVTVCETNITGQDFTATLTWAKKYGRGVFRDIHETSDGGYIVAGYTASFGAGGCDFWVIKLNASGDPLWQKTYGGTNDDCSYSIQETSYGGYIVAGETRSFGAGEYDFWVIKLDASGDPLWQKTYGGTSYDYAYSIQEISYGGYIVAGKFPENGVVLRTDSNGDIDICGIVGNSNATVTNTNVSPADSSATFSDTDKMVIETKAMPQDTIGNVIQVCPSFH